MPTTTVLLLRRNDQPLEILPPADGAGPDSIRLSAYPATGVLDEFEDADLIYSIDLPPGYEVRPADWRPLIDDRAALTRLIGETIRHNLRPLLFEPVSDPLLRRAEEMLRLAMADLSRAFDLETVKCLAGEDGTVTVEVTGEHKNGERFCCVVPFISSDLPTPRNHRPGVNTA